MAYASWELKGAELKYHSSKLEFMALKWAVTEQFQEYLQYQPFTVRTDNNIDLHFNHTEPRHIRLLLGSCVGRVQHEARVP